MCFAVNHFLVWMLALLASALVVGGSLIFGAISLTTLIGTRKEGATVPPAPQA